MPSRQFGLLKKNIADLDRQFLNFKKREDGKYTNFELNQCRAYITFCHSEIEIYLEAMALRIINKAENQWRKQGSVTNAIAAMISYRGSKEPSLPQDPIDQAPKKQFATVLHGAVLAQKAAIRRNHGVKRNNLAELFVPLGLGPSDFEEALLIQLDALGDRRGDHVHQSSKVSLPKVRDPFDDEKKDISFLLADLLRFDELALKLR